MVAALDAVQIPDHTKSEAVIPDNKERVPQFKEWKESRLRVAKELNNDVLL